MPRIHIQILATPEPVPQETLEIEVDISEEVYQEAFNKTLTKFDVGPFMEGGLKYVFHSLCFDDGYPVIRVVESPH